jgi:hypothetical protein
MLAVCHKRMTNNMRIVEVNMCVYVIIFIAVVIFISNTRPLEACNRYYKIETFNHYRGLLTFIFLFEWYFEMFVGIVSECILCSYQLSLYPMNCVICGLCSSVIILFSILVQKSVSGGHSHEIFSFNISLILSIILYCICMCMHDAGQHFLLNSFDKSSLKLFKMLVSSCTKFQCCQNASTRTGGMLFQHGNVWPLKVRLYKTLMQFSYNLPIDTK